ncbi:SUKH-3 domain-containing protein [Micromonospora siamensis]|uniref:SUKH-3 immunity protein n=1 Tax=Micromonospora siamensis TaxID=299152 RepID=A0A1C5HFK4_9ACTN|nr:SUKH-3 domain-containing protein [Micromonospora siamensis]SCG44780.1 SUKH-3 immunity protein [Micromonospora siamensis]
MIDRQQAEQLATVWARRDSQRLGFECRATVDEFDLGYIIRSTVARDAQALPGDLPTTVVDKETGDVSTWPRVPAAVVEQMYRRSRPADPAPRTVDPASQLLREIRRLPTPGTAAHLTVEGRTYVAHGAKGDVELNHHPMVRAYLDGLPAGRLVRGGERHAEIIVVSDVLHEYDHRREATGDGPLTVGDAMTLFEGSRLQVFQIREPGDRNGGEVRDICESCTRALVQFGVLPWGELGRLSETPPLRQQPIPHPDRFPPEVAQALADGGWDQHELNDVLADGAMAETCEVTGRTHRHEPFPAATRVFLDFPAIVTLRRRPGREIWIRQFDTNPVWAAHTADTLADFAQVLGVRLFPIGTERQDSILAVDEHGRIFALDQAGEWFIGPDIDTALTNLLLGIAPARVRDDGTW